MDDIDARSCQAQALWDEGERCLAARDYKKAWRLYTQAHDLVTDCAALHRQAHRRLRQVNRRNGHWGEYLTDCVLLALAPLGVFELLALLFRSRVAKAEQCRRAQAGG